MTAAQGSGRYFYNVEGAKLKAEAMELSSNKPELQILERPVASLQETSESRAYQVEEFW